MGLADMIKPRGKQFVEKWWNEPHKYSVNGLKAIFLRRLTGDRKYFRSKTCGCEDLRLKLHEYVEYAFCPGDTTEFLQNSHRYVSGGECRDYVDRFLEAIKDSMYVRKIYDSCEKKTAQE